MRRLQISPRLDWIQKAESVGFTYHSLGEAPEDATGVYWYEAAAYEFTAAEIDAIETATEELHRLCLSAVDYVVRHPEEMDGFAIPAGYRPYVARSWMRGDPYWMGRFDLAYDQSTGAIKLLEYNADTPTLVVETALMQWFWLQDQFPNADQFNLLHELLLERISWIGQRMPRGETLYFAGLLDLPEEAQHVAYFTDLASQAGIRTKIIAMGDIGWKKDTGFVDLAGDPIRFVHKLYPWEWMAAEAFGMYMLEADPGVIEPPWKMLLSNKAILPVLWKLFPGHPNLLSAGWTREDVGSDFVQKPILAREGANMTLVRRGQPTVTTGGSYGASPTVYQTLASLPVFDDQHVVLGSWVVGEKAAGLIVRESENLIVVNTSRVVPHLLR